MKKCEFCNQNKKGVKKYGFKAVTFNGIIKVNICEECKQKEIKRIKEI